MKRLLLVGAAVVLLALRVAFAQESPLVQRPQLTEERLRQTEKSLVMALESNSPGLQASAAQTLRELKELLPERSFSRLVIPLMRVVKDESGDVPARILAALALSELHSEMGDFAIKGVAKFTGNPRLAHLCTALALRKMEETQLARAPIQRDSTGIAKR